MDTPQTARRIAALVALKPAELAKSRFDTVAAPLRRRLAWTMAVDTLAALAGAVEEIMVVSDQPSLESRLMRCGIRVRVLPESHRTGMNGALDHGAEALSADGYSSVLACVGDLPALTSDSVRRVLTASLEHRRSFLADASGTGTTMMIAHEVPLEPHFQGRSAAAHHQSGAVALTDSSLGASVLDARRDVDTEVDLAAAFGLGLGAATAQVVDPGTGQLGHYTVITVAEPIPASSERRAITADGIRVRLPPASVERARPATHTGQRLHAVLAGDAVLAAWR